MKEYSAKERILKKIRKALLNQRNNPYRPSEEIPLFNPVNEPIDVLFAEQFTAAGGYFVFCEDELQLVEHLISIAEREELFNFYVWEEPLKNMLSSYKFPFFSDDLSFRTQADIGITTCEALISRTGSILISNASASGRRLSIFPPIHIVIAFTSQLVLDIKDGLKQVQEKYDNHLPSMLSTITGPSRTADIEKTLVVGAHGPKKLYLLLLDDLG